MPVGEIADAALRVKAVGVTIGITALPGGVAAEFLDALSRRLLSHVQLFVGGPGGYGDVVPSGGVFLRDFDVARQQARKLKQRSEIAPHSSFGDN